MIVAIVEKDAEMEYTGYVSQYQKVKVFALFLIWVTMVGFINIAFKFIFRVIQDTVFVKDTI